MNITIKITYWGGTVMDVCIPVAIETPKPAEAPQPAVVAEEEPQCSVEPDDILPDAKHAEDKKDLYGEEALEFLKETIFSEPEQPQDTGDQFRCTDGYYSIPPNLYSDFCAAFGQTMVDQQLTLARLWVETNPPKRKTRRGMGRFLNAWMCRAQGEKRQPLKGRSGSLLEANNTSSQGW